MSYMFHISQLLIDNNVVVEFIKNICFIKARTIGDLLLKGVAKGGLYQIQDFSYSISNKNSLVFYYETLINKPLTMFATLFGVRVLSLSSSILVHLKSSFFHNNKVYDPAAMLFI